MNISRKDLETLLSQMRFLAERGLAEQGAPAPHARRARGFFIGC
jgi:hypothetical protein